MALSICRTYLLYVPIKEVKKSCTNRLILELSIDNRISFQNHFFLMLIAQDPCSKENNIPVYVRQIFQKLRLYQNRVEPLLRVYKLKKNKIVRPIVSQLHIICEYRISKIGPKKHV